MKKNIILIVLVCLGTVAYGQKSFSAQYTIGIPMADLKDYIGEVSFRGATLDFRNKFSDNVSAGFSIGWNVFFESLNGTFEEGPIAITGVQYRYTNSLPMLITADYYLATEGVKPFVGLGIGTIWTERVTEMGLYYITTDTWHFALSPEAGFSYDLNENTGVIISVRYNNAFKTDDLESQSFLALNLGLVFGH